MRRLGVPILTGHSIIRADGEEGVESAIICRLDNNWRKIPGTEQMLEVDAICLAVGLTPLTELLWQAGCEMVYIPQLGGHVPLRDEKLETSVRGLYVAGDCSGVEEATAAILEGKLAGLNALKSLRYKITDEVFSTVKGNLEKLRSGPVGEKIRTGLVRAREGSKC